MKFDYIIANPPYQKGLHLKFLDKCIDMKSDDGEIIFVHPAEWLVQKRKTSRTKVYDTLKSKIKGANITFIDNPWGLDAALFVPLCMTYINNNIEYYFTDNRTKTYGNLPIKQKSKIKLNSLYEITTFGNPNTTLSFINKLFVFCEKQNWKNKILINKDDFYLNLSRLSGNGYTNEQYFDNIKRKISNMYSILNSTSLLITNEPQRAKPQGKKSIGNEKIWVSFESNIEAKNALNFISKSKIFRVYLSIIKIDQNAANTLLPWIPWLDWSQEWTDDKLIEFFNLTDEEVQNIEEIINIITIK